MAINITDGFNVLKGTPGATSSDSAPIDYRMVVDDAAARTSLLYKYDGMKVFQRDNRLTYVWNSSTSTWSIDQNLSATGSLNYIPKVTSTSPIINYGNSAIYCDSNNRVGINTNNPTGLYTYLQIGGTNSSEDPYSFPGQSLPLVFHKGANALIAYNYYYDGSGPQVFDLSSGSSLIGFEGTSGDISFQIRPANSSPGNISKKLIISKNDIIADIHNKGTNGIGDYGNYPDPWSYPAISSGEFSNISLTYSINCSDANPGIATWMRVGNVVSVSGNLMLKIISASNETSFALTLPIKSYFHIGSLLNGVAKIRYDDGTSYYDGDVASIEAFNDGSSGYAIFRFNPSVNGFVYITYIYQYVIVGH